MLERRRVGGGARGGTPSHRLGWQIERQINKYYKIHRGLKWPINATTNQNLAAATEGSLEGICDKRDVWGTWDSGDKVQIEWINLK